MSSSKSSLVFGVVTVLLAITFFSCGIVVVVSADEEFDAVFTPLDQVSPSSSDVIRMRTAPLRPSDWCQYSQYQLRGAPIPYWKDLPAKKRGYMGIEIPDFITSQDGTQQQGSGQGAKPRYFKNG